MTELAVPQDCSNMSSGSRLSQSSIKKKRKTNPTLQHLHAKGCNTGFGRKRENAPAWEKSSSKLASVLIYIFTPKQRQLSEAKAWLYGRSNNARWEAAQHQPCRALTNPLPHLPPDHASRFFYSVCPSRYCCAGPLSINVVFSVEFSLACRLLYKTAAYLTVCPS